MFKPMLACSESCHHFFFFAMELGEFKAEVTL